MIDRMHIHEDTESRDCDGGHGTYNVIRQWAGETGRLAWTRYVAFQSKGYYIRQPGWSMKRETFPDRWTLFIGGPMDEGYSGTYAYTCTEEGCTESQYDQYAEMMGY